MGCKPSSEFVSTLVATNLSYHLPVLAQSPTKNYHIWFSKISRFIWLLICTSLVSSVFHQRRLFGKFNEKNKKKGKSRTAEKLHSNTKVWDDRRIDYWGWWSFWKRWNVRFQDIERIRSNLNRNQPFVSSSSSSCPLLYQNTIIGLRGTSDFSLLPLRARAMTVAQGLVISFFLIISSFWWDQAKSP